LVEVVDASAPPTPELQGDESKEPRSITELLERLGREMGELVLREGQLETVRNMSEVRRAGRDVLAAAVAAGAFLIAFAFVNVAVFVGLSAAVTGWLAALLLAGGWAVVSGALLVGLARRVRRRRFWQVFSMPPAGAIDELQGARDEAVEAVRLTLAELGPAISIEIAAAAVPAAGELAGNVIEASDEVVEAIAERLPAGSVVNQIWDVALMPGRFGLRVATTVLRRDSPNG
jgi:hypothetical protein